ncbi:DUF748 domain-containing protein [Thiomicrorhabdus sp.]|uniref:DUF748 domain-containing protein n=1 Tax=Thiomicrorhabdus sp. TaxID=2039724 RepID=UPI0029C6A5C7|nr:DUF748 domain-containing protein [Thiomicrorhabdus sp.]
MKGFPSGRLFSLKTFGQLTLLLVLGSLSFFQWGLKPLLKQQLEHQGFQNVSIAELSFNPFTAQIDLDRLNFTDAQQKAVFLGKLKATVNYASLFDKRFILEEVLLEEGGFDLIWHPDQPPVIAGIKIEPGTEESADTTSDWQFGIQQLKLNDIRLNLHLQEQTQVWQMRRLQLQDLYSDGTRLARLSLLSQLDQQPLNIDLKFRPIEEALKLSATLRLHRLDLATLLPLAQSLSPELSKIALDQGLLDLESTFTLEQKENTLALHQQGHLQISQLKARYDGRQLELPKFDWQGSLQSADLFQSLFSIQGKLDSGSLTFQQNDQQLKTRLQTTVELNADLGEKRQFELKGPIKLSNLEFQQKALQTRLKAFDWSGNLIYRDQAQYPLQLDGALRLSQLALTEQNWSSQVEETNWKGNLKAHFDEQKTVPQLSTQATLNIQKWQLASSDSRVSGDRLHSDFQINLNRLNDGLDYQGSLTISKAHIQQAPLQSSLENIQWQGTVHQSGDRFHATGRLQTKSLQIKGQDNTLLAELSALDLKQFLFDKQVTDTLEARDLQLENLTLIDPNDGTNLIRLQHLNLNRADWHSQQTIEIGTLALRDSEWQIYLDQNNRLPALDRWLSASGFKPTDSTENHHPKEAENRATSQTTPLVWTLQGINIDGKNTIQIRSEQTSPPLQQIVELENLHLGTLDSSQPRTLSDYHFKLKLLPFSELSTSGTIAPLAQPIQLQAETRLNDLSLLEYSSLLEKALGYRIESGQLSAQLDTRILQGKIDSSNRIQLRQFILKSVDKNRTEEFEGGFSIPLQTGLSLLEDKNKQIDLNLPVKGDLANPDFQIGDVIGKALNSTLLKASKTYLLLALQPFGAIALVGEMALDRLNAIELQSITFTPGNSELRPEMHTYLEKIHQLLQQRSKVRIKLCGGANAQDRDALEEVKKQQLQSKEKRPRDNQAILAAIRVSDRELQQLALERQTAVKRALIDLGTNGNQLILCQPEFDKQSKTPRIRLEI